ncbi:hypothetical protein QCA50_000663 [Cerrena zonata]|uniref:SH3 domain-containing protein n=1 Tax=Cerrena zonata TaxID=2478898 RepID=A0AAW0GRL1_9APHY
MSFTASDKEAFFALLDEYFAARPNLVLSDKPQETVNIPSAASIGRSLNNAAAGVQRSFSSATASDDTPRWKRPSAASNESSQSDLPSAAGRVAAAAAAFKFSPGQPSAPRAPPRPSPGESPEPEQNVSHLRTGSRDEPASGHLVSHKKFGDVDMSSGKNMFMSLRSSTANKGVTPPAAVPDPPPAFAPRKNTFGPPPVRHVSATSPPASRSSSAVDTPASPSPPPPPARPKQEPAGEWAEALYDYTSDDPGDLPLQENDRVLVVEKPSDDWWMGEIDGRRGLIPAAYVKLL